MRGPRIWATLAGLAAIATYSQYAHATNCTCDTFNSGLYATSSGWGTSYGSVRGINSGSGTGANGVYGSAASSTDSAGVWGDGVLYGVKGYSNTGTGGYFSGGAEALYAVSPGTKAIEARNNASTGGYGVYSYAMGSGSTAGYFESVGTSGVGVTVTAPFRGGWFTSSQTTGTAYGLGGECNSPGCTAVYANAPSGGTGLYVAGGSAVFAGAITGYGSLSISGTKNFSIDHPTKPGMLLQHASIESNEVLNIYRGKMTIDASGKAAVYMPAWFDAVNANTDVLVTCRGTVANWTDLTNGSFIVTAKAGSKCSWVVTGARNDSFIRANPFQVETPKGALPVKAEKP